MNDRPTIIVLPGLQALAVAVFTPAGAGAQWGGRVGPAAHAA
ncbi:MAG: hypothetical protein OEL53_03990 [Rhodospirillales bacterium]|nr:hypothetical protein [Rhodospirillales bacterium]